MNHHSKLLNAYQRNFEGLPNLFCSFFLTCNVYFLKRPMNSLNINNSIQEHNSFGIFTCVFVYKSKVNFKLPYGK